MSTISFSTPFHLLLTAFHTVALCTLHKDCTRAECKTPDLDIDLQDSAAVLTSIANIDFDKVTGLTEDQVAALSVLSGTIIIAGDMSAELVVEEGYKSRTFDLTDLTVEIDGEVVAGPFDDEEDEEETPASEPAETASAPVGAMGLTIPQLEEALQKSTALLMMATIAGKALQARLEAQQPVELKKDDQPAKPAPEPEGLKTDIAKSADEEVRASVNRLIEQLGLNSVLKR